MAIAYQNGNNWAGEFERSPLHIAVNGGYVTGKVDRERPPRSCVNITIDIMVR